MIDVIIKLVISFICIAITVYVVPYLKEKNLYSAVKTAVQAAEQLYKESGMGRKKYAYVYECIKSIHDIEETELTTLIESAVYEINQGKIGGDK